MKSSYKYIYEFLICISPYKMSRNIKWHYKFRKKTILTVDTKKKRILISQPMFRIYLEMLYDENAFN